MICALELENFKCFSSLRLEIGRLTLLTGFNSGGKSSAIQPLLLLSQGVQRMTPLGELPINGPIAKLGAVGDVLWAGAKDARIRFVIESESAKDTWVFSARAGERFLRMENYLHAVNSDKNASSVRETRGIGDQLAGLVYLSAVRDGAHSAQPMSDEMSSSSWPNVGSDGRFASYWYDNLADEEVSVEKLHPEESATTFRKQVDAWMGKLFPGAQATVQHISPVSLECLQFRQADTSPWLRPANVGYGLSYAFPIIVALLAAAPNQILVIDSPEAHLHPSAQSQMGQMLAHFAAAKVQIIVETHSDHLLNGVRLATKNASIAPEDIRMHFFTGASSEGHGVKSPVLNLDGRIDYWPEGFFDQAERDLAILSGWE